MSHGKSLSRLTCSVGSFVVALAAAQAHSAVIVSTNFSTATTSASLANNAVINSGGVNTDDFTISNTGTPAGNIVAIVGASAPKTLQFTNAVNIGSLNAANRINTVSGGTNAAWAGVSTGATGNNLITGSFEFVRLQAAKTGFRFLIGAADSAGAGTQLMNIEITTA